MKMIEVALFTNYISHPIVPYYASSESAIGNIGASMLISPLVATTEGVGYWLYIKP